MTNPHRDYLPTQHEMDVAANLKLKQQVTGLVDHIKQLEAEVAELRAIKFQRFNNEECWIYQGDGEDHLESLVCPVVMSAQQVMEFEKAQQRVAELEREVLTAKGFLSHAEADKAALTADNARLQARVAELEQSRSIVHTQLSNIEWNLQRQDNPSKDDWLRMIRNMMESLK